MLEDQKIQIIPITAILPQGEQGQDQPGQSTPGAQVSVPGLTEETTKILAESLINTLPLAIFPKLPAIEPEKVNAFNHEFYLYCQRKGINPMDYLFDEFGLAVCGLGIVGTHYTNWKELYGKGKKEQESGGNAAFDHVKELETKVLSEKELQAGIQ
ncbi:MAG: hypothetical protein WA144_15495 [Candidatus Methanoperedens sp.]